MVAPMILCARVSWPVPAVRVYFDPFWSRDDIWVLLVVRRAGAGSGVTARNIVKVPSLSDYLCRRCGCIGGKFCVRYELHVYEQPQRGARVKVAA